MHGNNLILPCQNALDLLPPFHVAGQQLCELHSYKKLGAAALSKKDEHTDGTSDMWPGLAPPLRVSALKMPWPPSDRDRAGVGS